MNPGLLVKLRPAGPWRAGPDSGARNRVDLIYHSDSLYAAVTAAMARLDLLTDWLAATAQQPQEPAVRFSSCFPFQDETGYIVPPRTIWPPMAGAPLTSAKVRWKRARFIPLGLVAPLLDGQVLDEEHWAVDGPSQCLVAAGRPGPFCSSIRWNAAVDRLSGNAERHATAGIEFRAGAGMWALISFAGEAQRERWAGPLRGALRLLADSGFGGERSRGWGRSEEPEFVEGTLPEMILARDAGTRGRADTANSISEPLDLPPGAPAPEPGPHLRAAAHWLLSLFLPAPEDTVDWRRGNYAVLTRGGRVESPVGHGLMKKQIRMVAEGSVLFAGESLRGMAADVAPEGLPHPVWRAGFALSVPIPVQGAA